MTTCRVTASVVGCLLVLPGLGLLLPGDSDGLFGVSADVSVGAKAGFSFL